MSKTLGDVAKALLDGKSVKEVSFQDYSADWSVPAWALPDGTYLVNDDEVGEKWTVVKRYSADDGYPGLPPQHRDEADGSNDVFVEVEGPFDLLNAANYVFFEFID